MGTLIQGISRQEGFNVVWSRAARNNNPGNLNFEPWLAHEFGATLEIALKGEIARFAFFPTDLVGIKALRTLLLKDYLGLTVAKAIAKFAPSTENDVIQYVKNVCEFTGFTSDTVLTVENIG